MKLCCLFLDLMDIMINNGLFEDEIMVGKKYRLLINI